MGRFGWDFIAQGTGYSGPRDRLQRPCKGQATADGNGSVGFDGVVLIPNGGQTESRVQGQAPKEGEMEARVQRDRLVRFSQGTGSTAAMAIADGNGSGGI